MMNWLQLSLNKELRLSRGSLLRFRASYPFEDEVIMMICEAPDTRSSLGLMTISGYKAGINCYVVFPDMARRDDATISAHWLCENWCQWVWPEGSLDEVWVLPEGLVVSALK